MELGLKALSLSLCLVEAMVVVVALLQVLVKALV